jgi:hypothetical protein
MGLLLFAWIKLKNCLHEAYRKLKKFIFLACILEWSAFFRDTKAEWQDCQPGHL